MTSPTRYIIKSQPNNNISKSFSVEALTGIKNDCLIFFLNNFWCIYRSNQGQKCIIFSIYEREIYEMYVINHISVNAITIELLIHNNTALIVRMQPYRLIIIQQFIFPARPRVFFFRIHKRTLKTKKIKTGMNEHFKSCMTLT